MGCCWNKVLAIAQQQPGHHGRSICTEQEIEVSPDCHVLDSYQESLKLLEIDGLKRLNDAKRGVIKSFTRQTLAW